MAVTMAGIEDDLKELLETIPNVPVFNTEVPDDVAVDKPYITLAFTAPYRAARGRGIVSSRHDVNVAGVNIRACAASYIAARSISDQILDKVTGWSTIDTGEFTLEGGATSDTSNAQAPPTKYFRDLAFGFRCNLSFD